MTTQITNKISDYLFHHKSQHTILAGDDTYLPGEQDIPFPGPLMRKETKRNEVLHFIQRKSEECLQHVEEPDQKEAYFFWKMMELHCNKKKKVLLANIAAELLRQRTLLRKRLGAKNKDSWCLPLAKLLCSSKPDDKILHDVVQLGVDLDSKGLTYAAQLCYIAAMKDLDNNFELIGCKSLPISQSALREAIERTEVYEYVCSLTTGLPQSKFQIFKYYHASKLAELGLSDQAFMYCKAIAKAIAKFPQEITKPLMEMTITLSERLHQGRGTEPKWLLNVRQLYADKRFKPNDTKPGVMTYGRFSVQCPRLEGLDTSWEHFESLYESGILLGEGGMGQVYAGVRRADGKQIALKYLLKSRNLDFITIPGETQRLPLEVALMKMVSKPKNHENVVELLDWCEMANWYILIMEHPIPCTDLRSFMKARKCGLSEPEARHIMRQVVQAVRHCFECGVLHRDIKDSNILINTDSMQVKLIDFGCGALWQDTPYTNYAGTKQYVPPEWLEVQKYSGGPATVWSLGVLLFKVVCGRLPFRSKDAILKCKIDISPSVSEACRALILWCLARDPQSRPTFEEILSHEWFEDPETKDQCPLPESHITQEGMFESLYTKGELLGEGIHGIVYAGVRKADGKQVAMKYIGKTSGDKLITLPGESRSLPLEAALLKKVSKPQGCKYVVEMIEWFEMSDCYILVLERSTSNIDVQKFLKLHGGRLSETVAKIIMRQVVEAAQHCCAAGVFHGDMKAENFLIDPDTLEVKLIDFSCGDLFTHTALTKFKGNCTLASPEWLSKGEYFGCPATVWALGILLFYLVHGHYPFYSTDDIVNGSLDFDPSMSTGCRDLINWCLERSDRLRPTFQEILSHKWFTNE